MTSNGVIKMTTTTPLIILAAMAFSTLSSRKTCIKINNIAIICRDTTKYNAPLYTVTSLCFATNIKCETELNVELMKLLWKTVMWVICLYVKIPYYISYHNTGAFARTHCHICHMFAVLRELHMVIYMGNCHLKSSHLIYTGLARHFGWKKYRNYRRVIAKIKETFLQIKGYSKGHLNEFKWWIQEKSVKKFNIST